MQLGTEGFLLWGIRCRRMLAERRSTELGSGGAGLQGVVGDVGHESFAVGVRYRNQLIAEDDLAPFYDSNVVDIGRLAALLPLHAWK